MKTKVAVSSYNQQVTVTSCGNKDIAEEAYAIQASYSIRNDETWKREIDGLKKLDLFQPLKRMVIVTFDEEDTIGLDDGRAIEVIPAWKWLME